MRTEKEWTSPVSNCDLCAGPFGKVFYDARIPHVGSWGKLCHSCFTSNLCKLGVGHGQKYRRDAVGRWLKDDPERSELLHVTLPEF